MSDLEDFGRREELERYAQRIEELLSRVKTLEADLEESRNLVAANHHFREAFRLERARLEKLLAFNPVFPRMRNDSCRDWWYCSGCGVEAIHDGDVAPSLDVFPHAEKCPWKMRSLAGDGRQR